MIVFTILFMKKVILTTKFTFVTFLEITFPKSDSMWKRGPKMAKSVTYLLRKIDPYQRFPQTVRNLFWTFFTWFRREFILFSTGKKKRFIYQGFTDFSVDFFFSMVRKYRVRGFGCVTHSRNFAVRDKIKKAWLCTRLFSLGNT